MRTAIVLGLMAIFALLLHPLGNFPWIKRKLYRRLCAQLVLAAVLILVGKFAWPQSRESIEAQLNHLSEKGDWKSVEGKLKTIEGETTMHDVELYFRGLLYLNVNPATDPERFLSQVPKSSDLFAAAQRLRLKRYATTHQPELKDAIISTLDRAGIRNPVYFRLKLEPPPYLSYKQIVALYADFVRRNQYMFNFSTFNPELHATVGVYFSVDMNDVFEVPGCIGLFLQRELVTAQHECLAEQKDQATANYHRLVRTTGQRELTASMLQLNIDPGILEGMDMLAATPIPQSCHPD
jgi:hypothetical protein